MPPVPVMPPLLTDPLVNLVAHLSSEASIAKELLSLLEEEPQVLANRDHQAILMLAHRKQTLAEQLADAENVRRRYLEGNKLPLDLSALEKIFKDASAEEAAVACQNLKKIATACAEHNRNNGVFIESRLHYVMRALEIVTGRTSEIEVRGLTYGGNRNRLGRSTGRSWAKV